MSMKRNKIFDSIKQLQTIQRDKLNIWRARTTHFKFIYIFRIPEDLFQVVQIFVYAIWGLFCLVLFVADELELIRKIYTLGVCKWFFLECLYVPEMKRFQMNSGLCFY